MPLQYSVAVNMLMKKISLRVCIIFWQLFCKVPRYFYSWDGFGQFGGVYYLFNYQVNLIDRSETEICTRLQILSWEDLIKTTFVTLFIEENNDRCVNEGRKVIEICLNK